MLAYIARRLLALLPTVAVPMVLLFLLLRLTPGDPAASILGEDATTEQIEALREEMGLNAPLPVQFVEWLGSIARLDFGDSIFLREPVMNLVAERAFVTLQLALLAILVAVLVGPALGTFAATRRRKSVDQTLVVASAIGVAMPTFWLAIILIAVFGVHFGLLPVAGYVSVLDDPVQALRHLALPAISIGLLEAAVLFRYTRSGVLDARSQPFVTTARAQGIPEGTVSRRYVFRAATVPVVTVLGLTAAGLLGGAVVTESIFSIPGIGQLLLTAVSRRDYPLIEGTIFFIAVVFVLVNLLVDVVYGFLDPRIRLGAAKG
jgi:peptide/nickel transport system permease protein